MTSLAGEHPWGFLNVDKPRGVTSRHVVDRVAKLFRGQKAGHAGTLDPLATGVLVVAVGPATRLVSYVQHQAKSYHALVRLGARSDTLDAEGQIVATANPPVPDEPAVRAGLATQVGTIAQVPPQYSALKVEGQRAYKLARRGEPVPLEPRQVRIDRIELVRYEWPHLEIEVDCGAGTFIRSIARDVGEMLGCGGLIEELERTRIGPFTLEDAVDLDQLGPEEAHSRLWPADRALAHLPAIQVDAAGVAALQQGRAVEPPAGAVRAEGEVAVLGPGGGLVAIGLFDAATGRLQPHRVLAGG